jgi:serine/threonine protein phosphatase PrpC
MGTRKQDAFACFLAGGDAPAFCAIVCDGAGSAAYGGQGASLTCRILSVALRRHFCGRPDLPDDGQLWAWVDLARDAISAAAQRKGSNRRAFASTLVMLVVGVDGVLVGHIGDGAVVGREQDGLWRSLSWPDNGEYASTTYFVTDDPAPKLRLSRFDGGMDAFALFSDGIEDLALDQKATIPHEPFFRTMIGPLDVAAEPGKNRRLSAALAQFLGSARVGERTDDDKSLILASAK